MPAGKPQRSASRLDAPHNAARRLLPACSFLLALCALVTVVYGNGYGAPAPVEQRYAEAKSALEKLKSGRTADATREAWIRAAEEFQAVYALDPAWSNRPAAIFRMAETLEELARRSGTQSDYQSAAAVYEETALRHAQSRLADDALLRAAGLKARHTGEKTQALRLLERIRTQYPRGDMAKKATELAREIKSRGAGQKTVSRSGSQAGGTAEKNVRINRISWKTSDAGQVQIVVECDRGTAWQARREAGPGKKSPDRLVVELEDAVPLEQIKAGARVTGSPLTSVRFERGAQGRARLFFDFTALAGYTGRTEQHPFRIILDVASTTPANAAGREKDTSRKNGKVRTNTATKDVSVLRATAPQDLASQLGLTVRTVFLDAGHGGKDPGTGHNGIVERETTLDVTRRVGRLLRAAGLDVEYSRGKDVSLSLTERTRRANAAGADIFVSVHVNASADARISGFETYYLDPASNTEAARLATMENAGSDKKLGDMNAVIADFMLSARTQESRRLAGILQNTALSRLHREHRKIRDGGVKSAPLHVLIGTAMPAVLVELGYCTNSAEARSLANAAYRQDLACGIAEGVLAYRDRLLRRQSVDLKPERKPS